MQCFVFRHGFSQSEINAKRLALLVSAVEFGTMLKLFKPIVRIFKAISVESRRCAKWLYDILEGVLLGGLRIAVVSRHVVLGE